MSNRAHALALAARCTPVVLFGHTLSGNYDGQKNLVARIPTGNRRASSGRPRHRPAAESWARVRPEFRAAGSSRRGCPLDLGAVLEQGTLLGCQLGRGPRGDASGPVPAPRLTHPRQALPAQPVDGAGLRTRLDLER